MELAAIGVVARKGGERVTSGRAYGCRPTQLDRGFRRARLDRSEALGHGVDANGHRIRIGGGAFSGSARANTVRERCAWVGAPFFRARRGGVAATTLGSVVCDLG